MRVLVTGGTGFIGSHTVRAVIERGFEVRLLARTPTKVPNVLGPLGLGDHPGIEVVPGDATDPESVERALTGCDAAIHAAATVSMRARESAAVHATNVEAARVVLGTAVRVGCDPVVHVSSASVLERGAETTTLDAPIKVATGTYSRTKADIEWYARGLQDAGAPVVITYPSGVIGPHSPSLTAMHNAARTWIAATPLPPSGVSILDVRDLAAQHAATLEAGAGSRRFLAGGQFLTWPDLVATIEAVSGHAIRTYRVPGGVLRGLGRVIDVTHLPNPLEFDLTEEAMTEATRAVPYDSTATIDALGVPYRSAAETLADTYRWLAAEGHITPAQAGVLTGAPPEV